MAGGQRWQLWIAMVCGIAALSACHRSGEEATAAAAATPAPTPGPAQAHAFYTIVAQLKAPVPKMMALGKTMFMDPSLSASGQQACVGCHMPARAYAPDNNLSVQISGSDMKQPGVRATPSLRYLYNVPSFAEHFYDDEDSGGEDQGPTGGHTWDGRAQSVHEQVAIPLTSPFEMANANPDAVVERVKAAPYADEFRQTFGANIFDDPKRAFVAVQMSLESYLQTPEEFYPYSSKFDAVMRKQAQFTSAEARGFSLFNDARKGDCARCHISKVSVKGTLPLFTDWGHIALGVPRNNKIPANADPQYYDLGLCGPARTDLQDRAEYCGRFRTPSLRNVATRKVFFHNGSFHSLREVLNFYATRDTQPQRWYPRDAHGKVIVYDDLPERYRANVDRDPPFGGKPGDKPVLSDAEIDDMLAFLQTLNDGYQPTTTRKP